MKVDVRLSIPTSSSGRARMLESMFDVPRMSESVVEWSGDFPYESVENWSVGLIVGPSGSGKTTLLRECFGTPSEFEWGAASVIDDFDSAYSVEQIASTCQAVGFNTIPAWLRPHHVLSGGEQFRVDLARRLMRDDDPIVCDEFTSVVDRQVAKIGAHAVQKFVRRNGKRFVAASCHYDVIEWLQPDWTFEPHTMAFERRERLQRPSLECVVAPVPYAAWRIFAPYHYLTRTLHRSARCWGLWCEGHLAAFAGILYRPHPRARDVYGVSRLVTLPDWQGLGLAFVLVDALGGIYKAQGRRLNTYPAHPALIRGFDRSPRWALTKKPLEPRPVGKTSRMRARPEMETWYGGMGMRPNATFTYVGAAHADVSEARTLLAMAERR